MKAVLPPLRSGLESDKNDLVSMRGDMFRVQQQISVVKRKIEAIDSAKLSNLRILASKIEENMVILDRRLRNYRQIDIKSRIDQIRTDIESNQQEEQSEQNEMSDFMSSLMEHEAKQREFLSNEVQRLKEEIRNHYKTSPKPQKVEEIRVVKSRSPVPSFILRQRHELKTSEALVLEERIRLHNMRIKDTEERVQSYLDGLKAAINQRSDESPDDISSLMAQHTQLVESLKKDITELNSRTRKQQETSEKVDLKQAQRESTDSNSDHIEETMKELHGRVNLLYKRVDNIGEAQKLGIQSLSDFVKTKFDRLAEVEIRLAEFVGNLQGLEQEHNFLINQLPS